MDTVMYDDCRLIVLEIVVVPSFRCRVSYPAVTLRRAGRGQRRSRPRGATAFPPTTWTPPRGRGGRTGEEGEERARCRRRRRSTTWWWRSRSWRGQTCWCRRGSRGREERRGGSRRPAETGNRHSTGVRASCVEPNAGLADTGSGGS